MGELSEYGERDSCRDSFSPVPLLKEKYDRQIKILLFKCQIKVYLLVNIKMHCVAWEIRRQKVLCLKCVTV